MVGTGDMWEVPKSASDIKKGNYPTMDAPFKSYKCGERGSQIAIIDTMIKNVTDNIVQAQYIFYRDAGTDFRQARPIVNSKASKMITR